MHEAIDPSGSRDSKRPLVTSAGQADQCDFPMMHFSKKSIAYVVEKIHVRENDGERIPFPKIFRKNGGLCYDKKKIRNFFDRSLFRNIGAFFNIRRSLWAFIFT
jgi:hypothetical protein